MTTTNTNNPPKVTWPPLSSEEHERLDAQLRLHVASAEQYRTAGCRLADALLGLMTQRTRVTMLDATQALAAWERASGQLPWTQPR